MTKNNIENSNARFDALLRIAKSNESKGEVFRQKELKLIRLENLSSFIEEATLKHQKVFGLDFVILSLLDDMKVPILNSLAIENKTIKDFEGSLKFHDSDFFVSVFSSGTKPLLGKYHQKIHGRIFGEAGKKVKSIAVIPLERRGEIFGMLSLGSTSISRFKKSIGTHFLEHYAAVLMVCLDNVFLLSKVKDNSIRDPMTGLWNRRFFHEKAYDDLKVCIGCYPFSVMLIDIDKFKAINDTYGHDISDIVIKELAQISEKKLSSRGNICRFGGEEFVCWMPNIGKSDAKEIAEDFRKTVELHNFNSKNDNEKLQVTVSVGLVTIIPTINNISPELLDETLKIADQHLYIAKNKGRNRVISEKK